MEILFLELKNQAPGQGLVCCNTMQCCGSIPAFQRTMLSPYPKDGGITVLQNICNLSQHYMSSQPTKPELESSLL